MSRYTELSDEDKIEQSIRFIAVGQPLPEHLKNFLVNAGLYDMLVKPGELYGNTSKSVA